STSVRAFAPAHPAAGAPCALPAPTTARRAAAVHARVSLFFMGCPPCAPILAHLVGRSRGSRSRDVNSIRAPARRMPLPLRTRAPAAALRALVRGGGGAAPAPSFDPIVFELRKASGLGFVTNSGRTPHRHQPETMVSGVALLDFDGDGLLDVYAV